MSFVMFVLCFEEVGEEVCGKRRHGYRELVVQYCASRVEVMMNKAVVGAVASSR